MDETNGLPSGNHNMANKLKEMLKISGSPESQDLTSHDGAGDGMDQLTKQPRATSLSVDNDSSNETKSQSSSAHHENSEYQSVILENYEDGECIDLTGKETKIISNVMTELDSSACASSKIRSNIITKYEWEHRFYPGSLVAVTDMYWAYSIKNRSNSSVRVINRRNTSDRVLLKGFDALVTDIAFSHSTSNTIAAVDQVGNLLVYDLDQVAGNIIPELKLHLLVDEPSTSVTHRLSWLPRVETDQSDDNNSNFDTSKSDTNSNNVYTLVLFYKNIAEVWDLTVAYMTASSLGSVKLKRSQLSNAFVTVNDYEDEISDCELSPVNDLLAAASYDGTVKFWQIRFEDTEPPNCLHQWKPHDGKPVTTIRFCDDKKQSESSVYWRFLLTGFDRNVEIKIWCTVKWTCLQVVQFQPPTPGHAVPELHLLLHHSADFLVLSDIHRKVLYIMQTDIDVAEGRARISSITHFHLSSPLLSMALLDAKRVRFKDRTSAKEIEDHQQDVDSGSDVVENEDDNNDADDSGDGRDMETSKADGMIVKLFTLQEKCLEKLNVRFVPNRFNESKDNDSATIYHTSAEEFRDQSSADSSFRTPDVQNDESLPQTATDEVIVLKQDGNTREQATSSRDEAKTSQSADQQIEESETLVDISCDVTSTTAHPTVSPTLLTPTSFFNTTKSPDKNPNETVNTSFTSVTPYTNDAQSLYQQNQDETLEGFLPCPENCESSTVPKQTDYQVSSNDDSRTKTPPSSPVNSNLSSSSPLQAPAAAAAAEILKSYCSNPSTVQSPDLISSTAALDDTKHQSGASTPVVSSQPGLQENAIPISTISTPADVFSSILVPVTSSDPISSWPKAPDVTMSRPPVTRSSSQASSIHSVASQSKQSDDGSVSRVSTAKRSPDRPVSTNSDILASLKKLQQKQESIVTEQNRKLDAISKKQSHVQRQVESSSKKSDQHVDRVEKLVKTFSDSHRKLANDIKTSQAALSDAAVVKIDRAVKSEMKRIILPGINASMSEMKDELNSSVAKQLTATDTVIKEVVSKHVKSKDLVDRIAFSTSKTVMDHIQTSMPDLFFKTIVPAFDRSCQTMFQQLSSTYHKGMDETVKQLEKQMQFRLRFEYDRLEQVTKEAIDAVSQLQAASKTAQLDLSPTVDKQVVDHVNKLLVGMENRVTSGVVQALKKQQNDQQQFLSKTVSDAVKKVVDEKLTNASKNNVSVPSSVASELESSGSGGVTSQSGIFDKQEEILKQLLRGDYNRAFQIALTAANLNLVMYVCETVEPSSVFGLSPCPLQQPILLSLIQQLSSDLSTKTAIKLKYLQEAVMNLDRKHHITQQYMQGVLKVLVENLTAAYSRGPLDDQSLVKDLRMLAMAAQSLMT